MYLRHSTVRKNGKIHTYWRLVRSVRTGRRVRQETVACLGELDEKGRAKASALAEHFLGPKVRHPTLFDTGQPEDVEPTKVRIGQIRVERSRGFGDVWLAWTLWKALHLDDFCEAIFPRGKEKIAWADVVAILVFGRFCEPSSELHIAEDWYRKTALEDFLGVPAETVHHTRLYQALDRLLPHKAELEAHLKDRLGGLFGLDYDLLLYDVTSTYFEGEAKANSLAQRGYSRDQRPDCKQVCIGLVVTKEGYPLGYEVFAGNRTDVTTVEEIVETMEKRYGKADRVWVMDRGMISENNLEWLRQGGRKYVLGSPRQELKKWERELIDREGWERVRDGLEVKLCPGPDGDEVFILCRSEDRLEKEKAMHERFSARIIQGLESLGRRLERAKKPGELSQIERQIGRLLQRNTRAAGKFQVRVEADASRDSGYRLVWKENRSWSEWSRLTEGAYVLRSNVLEWDGEELWKTYTQLVHAEEAFRIQKSDLGIRPVWHQRTERVLSHILVCFLAYALWKTLEGWMRRAGLGRSPRTALDELRRIPSVDVILPLADNSGRELTLRCVVRPSEAQAALLDRLGLDLPRRLRPPTSLPAEV